MQLITMSKQSELQVVHALALAMLTLYLPSSSAFSFDQSRKIATTKLSNSVKPNEMGEDKADDFAEEEDEHELFSLLQTPGRMVAKAEKPKQAPFVVKLRREVVPIYRNNEVVSFKTSHSGMITVGNPEQEFRVVFDTGSGHVVLPSSECKSESCMEHKRYSVAASPSATAINVDGSRVPAGKLCDQVTIGFGTGSVTGQFVREQVCFVAGECVEMNIVEAVEMSVQPFKSFLFDGIFGLGLNKLSLSPAFSFLSTMKSKGKVVDPWFGVYLSDGENGEESEIALGGSNPLRYQGDLRWAKVAMPEKGHWQIAIRAIRIGNQTMSVCEDGTCRGIVDTGTSHLGIPGTAIQEITDLLTFPVEDTVSNCQDTEGIKMEIDLGSFTLELFPRNYMRKLPLQEGVTVGSKHGVSTNSSAEVTAYENQVDDTPLPPGPKKCRPRLMPVNLPAPLGPKLFLLGEPVLHRYYTVYNWDTAQIGFGLAVSPSEASASVLI